MSATTDEAIRDALERDRIAVVGCSTTAGKPAHDVPKYLQERGYEIVPVNPYAEDVLGAEAYDSLTDVEGEVDVVEVFRPSEEVSGIVDEAIARDDDPVVWLQQGIHDDEAAERAREAGLTVVQDRCMMVEHQSLADS